MLHKYNITDAMHFHLQINDNFHNSYDMNIDEIVADGDYGPAMSRLDDRQRAFVVEVIQQGKKRNLTQAAIAAGYSNHPGTSRLMGHDLLHRPAIIEALHEESRRRFTLAGWLGVLNLIGIAENDEHPEYYKASKDLADRFGYGAITEHKVSVQHMDLTGDAILQRIKALAAKHGLDEAKLIGGNVSRETVTIEAKATEVKDA